MELEPPMTEEDQLLAESDVESALSIAYVQAIAAMASYHCFAPSGPDRDSIDVQVAAGGEARPKLDLQLKSTVNLTPDATGQHFSYPLKVKNYNDLIVTTQTPRVLVVLDLPRDRSAWLGVSIEELIIRRAAYWLHLRGYPSTTNSVSVTVSIPRRNIFDVESLRTLMERSRVGQMS